MHVLLFTNPVFWHIHDNEHDTPEQGFHMLPIYIHMLILEKKKGICNGKLPKTYLWYFSLYIIFFLFMYTAF